MILSIIIVSYNTEQLTIQTINSVIENIKSSKLLSYKVEIILIDNDSTDDSVKSITKLLNNSNHKNIFSHQIIKNKDNQGFAKANNICIKKSSGKYILLLNSDIIVKSNSLEKLVNNFEKQIKLENINHSELTAYSNSHKNNLDKLGILSATLLNTDGTFQPQGGSFPSLFSLFNHMTFLDDIPVIGKLLPSTQHTGRNTRKSSVSKTTTNTDKQNNLTQQDWVGGTAMMIRRSVISDIGDLDQNIFMYGEDIELCMRAKNHHWDIAIDPSAKIVHLGNASSSSENAILGEFKGYVYIWSKHKPQWQIPLVKMILKLGAILRIILFSTLVKRPKKVKTYKKSLKII